MRKLLIRERAKAAWDYMWVGIYALTLLILYPFVWLYAELTQYEPTDVIFRYNGLVVKTNDGWNDYLDVCDKITEREYLKARG